MRKLLLASTASAGLLIGLACTPAFAAVIPVFSSETLVAGGADFSYAVSLSTDQETDVQHGFANLLRMTGGGLGATTKLVSENSFLTNFAFSTGAHSIALTCAAGSATCGADTNGPLSATLVLFSPDTAQILGSFNAQATKNAPGTLSDETKTINLGSVEVPTTRVPEPASLALLGTGLLGLGLIRRWRRKV